MGKTKAVVNTKKTKGKRKAIYIGDPNVYKVDRILQERKVGRKVKKNSCKTDSHVID